MKSRRSRGWLPAQRTEWDDLRLAISRNVHGPCLVTECPDKATQWAMKSGVSEDCIVVYGVCAQHRDEGEVIFACTRQCAPEEHWSDDDTLAVAHLVRHFTEGTEVGFMDKNDHTVANWVVRPAVVAKLLADVHPDAE